MFKDRINWPYEGFVEFKEVDSTNCHYEVLGYYSSGKLKFQYTMINGLMHGTCRLWYESGRISKEENYAEDKLHGISRQWYEDGPIQREVNYIYGREDGTEKYWCHNGYLDAEFNYTQGRRNGFCKRWNIENNRLLSLDFYLNDRLHGLSQSWNRDGRLVERRYFFRGVRIPRSINKLIESSSLAAHHILRIRNAEVRRICFEVLTYERFLMQMKHEIIARENDSELVRIDWYKNEEPVCLVKVRCPSSGAFYTLRVPPDMKTVKEAVAWTFNVESAEYLPLEEA